MDILIKELRVKRTLCLIQNKVVVPRSTANVNEKFTPTDPLTKLVPDLCDVPPDDATSSVAYEKGHTLLYYLEEKVGGQEVFEQFLRSYLKKFMYKSITTSVWREYFLQYFKDKGMDEVLKDIDWDTWFYKPGMPPLKPKYKRFCWDSICVDRQWYDETLVEQCTKLCEKWISADEEAVKSFTTDEYSKMSANQREEFLSQLLDQNPLPHFKLERMKELYGVNIVKNMEIKFVWIRLCLKARWPDVVTVALDFVTEQGRMKFTRPVYKDLFSWDYSRCLAIETFQRNRPFMHSMTALQVEKILAQQQ